MDVSKTGTGWFSKWIMYLMNQVVCPHHSLWFQARCNVSCKIIISSPVINASHLNPELFNEKLCSLAFNLQVFHGEENFWILSLVSPIIFFLSLNKKFISRNLLRILPHKTLVGPHCLFSPYFPSIYMEQVMSYGVH